MGFSFNWSVASGRGARVELYIDTGDQATSKGFFDALCTRAPELSAELDCDLEWERLDNRRASRVATYHPAPESPPLDENSELHTWAIATMVRWNDVLRPIIKTLTVPAPST